MTGGPDRTEGEAATEPGTEPAGDDVRPAPSGPQDEPARPDERLNPA
jgi:hypothetical protein